MKFILSIAFILSYFIVTANSFKGVVFDSKNNEPLPYVTVIIKGTTTGTMTDLSGKFLIDKELKPEDIIQISFIGYKSIEIKYDTIANIEFLPIFLEHEEIAIEEIQVSPDNSYARSIIKNIVKNRKRNNPDNFEIIKFNKYSRESIFLTNLGFEITKKRAFRNNKNAFITQTDSTVAMPVFFSEQQTTNHINKEKRIDETEVVDTKTQSLMPNIQNTINTVVSEKLTTSINFYDNQTNVLSRGFPSPISWNNQIFYNTYLVDSLIKDEIKYYRFDFYPKSYRSTAFKGYYWVDGYSFALTEIYAKLPATANVNFVKSFEALVYYQKVEKYKWFYKSQKIKLELSVSTSEINEKQTINLTVQNMSDYYNIQTGGDTSELASIKNLHPANKLYTNYEKIPFDSLETRAYEGIKTLRNNKTIKTISRFSDMAINGYYNLNKIDLGSYMDIYRKNAIEGDRWTLPLRTSEKMFEKFSVGGYVGYGFKDKEIKYGAKMNYELPWKRRTILTLKYDEEYYALTKDKFIEFIRENPYEAGGGNVMSSITTRVPNPYLLKQHKMSFTFQHQLARDIGILVRPFFSRYYSNANVPFIKNGNYINHFDNYGIATNFRFSFNQPFDDGYFYRVYYGNQKPVIHLSTVFAKASFFNGNKNVTKPYLNINVSLKNRVNFGPAFLKVLFNVGYIIGDVPFPLLHMPRGTQDLGFARYHYNLLYNSSFAADLYSNLHLSLNGGGSMFGKIPLIKKLNLREIISFKSFWGTLTGDHASVMDVPDFLHKPLSTPYMELGFGITNIFKVVRVEYIRRLNSTDFYNQFSSKHGVRLRIEVSF